MKPREYTADEANATLPAVKRLLGPLREALYAHKFAREQLEDLTRMYGDALASPECPMHDEAATLRAEVAEQDARVRAFLLEFQALGVEVKDPVTGLVDFYGRRGDDLVYLCWKEGEPSVSHWHPLVGGFDARRPL